MILWNSENRFFMTIKKKPPENR
ncbi:MAG: hypothetical protein ACD_2C00186G0001, partial [uncultured bacterium (gcode 4)]